MYSIFTNHQNINCFLRHHFQMCLSSLFSEANLSDLEAWSGNDSNSLLCRRITYVKINHRESLYDTSNDSSRGFSASQCTQLNLISDTTQTEAPIEFHRTSLHVFDREQQNYFNTIKEYRIPLYRIQLRK